jgi:hypothetical protein
MNEDNIWKCLNNKVYKNYSKNITEVKNRIIGNKIKNEDLYSNKRKLQFAKQDKLTSIHEIRDVSNNKSKPIKN